MFSCTEQITLDADFPVVEDGGYVGIVLEVEGGSGVGYIGRVLSYSSILHQVGMDTSIAGESCIRSFCVLMFWHASL